MVLYMGKLATVIFSACCIMIITQSHAMPVIVSRENMGNLHSLTPRRYFDITSEKLDRANAQLVSGRLNDRPSDSVPDFTIPPVKLDHITTQPIARPILKREDYVLPDLALTSQLPQHQASAILSLKCGSPFSNSGSPFSGIRSPFSRQPRTYSAGENLKINEEYQQLKQTIDHSISSTTWGGVELFNQTQRNEVAPTVPSLQASVDASVITTLPSTSTTPPTVKERIRQIEQQILRNKESIY
jgi:hypothetical protein